MKKVAVAKRLKPVILAARDDESLRQAFVILKKERPGGIVISNSVFVTRLIREIIDGVRALRIPAVYGFSRFVEAGGLMSYGQNSAETFRYAAKFVDRILKGAKPADLPVEQVSKFEILVNKKAASEIGVKIPQSILIRTDRVIE